MSSYHPIQGLYAIIDNHHCPQWDPVDLADAYLKGGAKILQLRQKATSLAEKTTVAQKIMQLKQRYDFTFIINDEVDLACEIDADGVHLGQDDRPPAKARALLGPDKLIGLSTHSVYQAKQAFQAPIDYIGVGAVMPTPTKSHQHPIIGLKTLAQIVKLSPVAVVAIGGIHRLNLDSILQTGVASVAMISALTRTPNPEFEVASVIKQIGRNCPSGGILTQRAVS